MYYMCLALDKGKASDEMKRAAKRLLWGSDSGSVIRRRLGDAGDSLFSVVVVCITVGLA